MTPEENGIMRDMFYYLRDHIEPPGIGTPECEAFWIQAAKDLGAVSNTWKNHPLAGRESITFEDLRDYPCLSFEQGDSSYFYYAEEMLSTEEYSRQIWANDRATVLNLMVGLNGYTICSGIICEELNGGDFLAVPFVSDSPEICRMEIGYIVKQNMILSQMAEKYIRELEKYLHNR